MRLIGAVLVGCNIGLLVVLSGYSLLTWQAYAFIAAHSLGLFMLTKGGE
jgi:hypothetical protein